MVSNLILSSEQPIQDTDAASLHLTLGGGKCPEIVVVSNVFACPYPTHFMEISKSLSKEFWFLA